MGDYLVTHIFSCSHTIFKSHLFGIPKTWDYLVKILETKYLLSFFTRAKTILSTTWCLINKHIFGHDKGINPVEMKYFWLKEYIQQIYFIGVKRVKVVDFANPKAWYFYNVYL